MIGAIIPFTDISKRTGAYFPIQSKNMNPRRAKLNNRPDNYGKHHRRKAQGCGGEDSREWRPGHNSKRVSVTWHYINSRPSVQVRRAFCCAFPSFLLPMAQKMGSKPRSCSKWSPWSSRAPSYPVHLRLALSDPCYAVTGGVQAYRPGRRLERLEELAKRGLATVFIQSESYQNRRSVSGGSTHSLHSDHRVRKCNYSNLLLMCAGNSRWNYNRNGNRSWCVGIGYCNLYRCHHKLCRIGVFREIHRISELWNS